MPKQRVHRHEVVQPQDPSYKLIPLTQGQNAIVDAKDFDRLNAWNWYAHWAESTHSFYAQRTEGDKPFQMAHAVLGCKRGEQVDHRNHDTLDNRSNNLRKCSSGENACNHRIQKNNTSGFVGVCWRKDNQKWRVRIGKGKVRTNLGNFSSIEEAVSTYEKAVSVYHGEFARP